MKGYRAVDGVPFDGDIVVVEEGVMDDTIPVKRWDARFVKRKQYLQAVTVRNNGSIWAKDKSGKFRWIDERKVIACYRKGVA